MFPLVACPFCAANGTRQPVKRVDRFQNPECFWLADTYWRHVHERHPLVCAWVGERIRAYLHLELPADEDLRLMLHLGDCKECQRQASDHINASRSVPGVWAGLLPEG